MAGKFGKFGLKALFVSCPFIVHVAEAPASWPWKHELMKISLDVAVTIDQCSLRKSTSKAQLFKNELKFSIDFIQRS